MAEGTINRGADAVGFFDGRASVFDGAYQVSESFKERFTIWARLIDEYCPENAIVLDVGCGPGIFTSYAAKRAKEVLAIDGSRKMLDIAQSRARTLGQDNVTFREMRLENVGGDGRFDLIICSSVLDYSEDLGRDLDVLTALLKKGGRMLVSLPNAWCFFRYVEKLTYRMLGWPRNVGFIKNVRTPAFLRKELEKRGTKVLTERFYGSALRLSQNANVVRPKILFNTLFVVVCEPV